MTDMQMCLTPPAQSQRAAGEKDPSTLPMATYPPPLFWQMHNNEAKSIPAFFFSSHVNRLSPSFSRLSCIFCHFFSLSPHTQNLWNLTARKEKMSTKKRASGSSDHSVGLEIGIGIGFCWRCSWSQFQFTATLPELLSPSDSSSAEFCVAAAVL